MVTMVTNTLTLLVLFLLIYTTLAVQKTPKWLQNSDEIVHGMVANKMDIVVDFLENISEWIKNKKLFTKEKFMIINFGFTGWLPHDQLSMSSSSPVVRVDVRKDGIIPSHFNFTCQGESDIDNSTKLLIRKGKVNKLVKDICPKVPVKVAYNEFGDIRHYGENKGNDFFRIIDDEMVPYQTTWSAYYGRASTDEILSSFFIAHNLTPIWLDANGTWGWFDTETGLWTGAVALVGYNEADLGVRGFGCDQARSTMVDCSHPLYFGYKHWISREPRPVLPVTNLFRIFDIYCWVSIFISMISVYVFFLIAAKVGTYYGVGSASEDVVLFPFRLPLPNYVPYPSNRVSFNMHLLIPRGFSANLVLVIWCLFGGVLQWGFESNIRTMMFMPMLEPPLDTAQDILDKGMIPITMAKDGRYWLDHLKASDNKVYRQLAEKTMVMRHYGELWAMLRRMQSVKVNTYVYLGDRISRTEETLGYWYYSKEKLEGANPYRGWIVNKKWSLNDELAKHILIYQQAGLMANKPYKRESAMRNDWTGCAPPGTTARRTDLIEMKHLIIPFTILVFGHAAAWLWFLCELALSVCMRQRQAGTEDTRPTVEEEDGFKEEEADENDAEPDYDAIEILEIM